MTREQSQRGAFIERINSESRVICFSPKWSDDELWELRGQYWKKLFWDHVGLVPLSAVSLGLTITAVAVSPALAIPFVVVSTVSLVSSASLAGRQYEPERIARVANRVKPNSAKYTSASMWTDFRIPGEVSRQDIWKADEMYRELQEVSREVRELSRSIHLVSTDALRESTLKERQQELEDSIAYTLTGERPEATPRVASRRRGLLPRRADRRP